MTWKTVGASVRGVSHLRAGLPCQDAHFIAQTVIAQTVIAQTGNILVLVVSDGAGSAAQAQVGSELACEVAGEWLQQHLDDLSTASAPALLQAVRLRLEAEATRLKVPPRELACTLSAAVLAPAWAWFLQVGDGAVVTEQAPGEWKVVFWPDNGEYANQTHFVTDPAAPYHCEHHENVPQRVALLTDGLHPIALQLAARRPHGPFFAPLFAALEGHQGENAALAAGLATFLDSPGVNARVDDDKTLVLASRR